MDEKSAREDLINTRIKREQKRLAKLFKNSGQNNQKSTEKLIERAAFMLVSLEDMEADIKRDGLQVNMQQGDYTIKRAHPLLSPYTAMMKNYAAVCRLLEELLPADEANKVGTELMGFAAKGVKS